MVLNFTVALRCLYATEKRVQMVEGKVFYIDVRCIVPGPSFVARFTDFHYKPSCQPKIHAQTQSIPPSFMFRASCLVSPMGGVLMNERAEELMCSSLWHLWSPGSPSCFSLQVTEVCFSPDETHCATCGEDGSVRIWSQGSMELVVQFQVLNQVIVCEISISYSW